MATCCLLNNSNVENNTFLSCPGFGGGKYISFEERQWHQPCFTCTECSVSLVGAGFFPNGDQILCRDCNTNSNL